jgi:uncharacterized repeat protein (TIGR01451 family)
MQNENQPISNVGYEQEIFKISAFRRFTRFLEKPVTIVALFGLTLSGLAFINTEKLFSNAATTPTANETADLQVSKSVDKTSTSVLTDTLTYNVVFKNNGPSNATAVIIKENLPTTGTIPTIVSCVAAGVAVCPSPALTVAQLASGYQLTSLPNGSSLTYLLTVKAPTAGLYTNSAVITPTPGTNDPNPSNNTASVETKVGTCNAGIESVYKMDYTKTTYAGFGTDGGTFILTYSLTSGPQVTGAGASFTVPVTYSDLNNNFGADNKWEGGTNVIFPSQPGMSGIRPNVTTLNTGLPSTNTQQEAYYGSTTPPDVGDKALIDSGAIQNLGTFSATIGNVPPATGNFTLVSESIEVGSVFNGINNTGTPTLLDAAYWARPQGATPSTSLGASSSFNPAVSHNSTIIWDYTAFKTNLNTNVASNSTNRDLLAVRNGQVTYSQPDINCDGQPDDTDLKATKTSNKSIYTPGELVTYSVAFANNDTKPNGYPTIQDSFPANLDAGTIVSCVPSGAALCPVPAITLAQLRQGYQLGTIMPAASKLTYTITGKTTTGGDFTNTATITPYPGVTERLPADNSPTVTARVPIADLQSDKQVDKTAAAWGDKITYTIKYFNNGPDTSTGVILKDTFPAGVTDLVIVSCVATGAVVCPSTTTSSLQSGTSLPAFPTGSSLTYVVTATVPVTDTNYINTASISSPSTFDPNTSNDTSSVTTTTQPKPGLDCSSNVYGVENTLGSSFKITQYNTTTGAFTVLPYIIPGNSDGATMTKDGKKIIYNNRVTGTYSSYDVTTGAVVNGAATTETDRVGYNPVTNQVVSILGSTGFDGLSPTWYNIDPSTLSKTLVGTITDAPGNPVSVKTLQGGDVIFDSLGRAYMIDNTGNLFRVDPNTLVATYLFNVPGITTAAGLSFTADGKVVVWDASAPQIKIIDLSNNTVAILAAPTINSDGLHCSYPVLDPKLVATKTVSPTGFVKAGDVLTYTISVKLTGNILSQNTDFADAIPFGTTYVNNTTSLNGSVVLDVGGLMPFSTDRKINSPGWPSGTIVSGTGKEAVIKFSVRVNTPIPPSINEIANQGTVKNTMVPTIVKTDDPTKTGTEDPTTNPIAGIGKVELDKEGTFKDENGDGKAQAGETITYKFTVKNTGLVPLTNVVVTDPKLFSPQGGVLGGPIASLAPGAIDSTTFTGFYTLTQADIVARQFANVATVSAKDPSGITVLDNSNDPKTLTPDDPTTVIFPQDPKLELDKTATLVNSTTPSKVGDKLNYTFTVKNTGNVPLTGVTVTDPLPGLVITGGPIANLAVGAIDTTTFTATYTLTQQDIDKGNVINQATATGQPPVLPDGSTPPKVTDKSNDPKTTTPDDPTVNTLIPVPLVLVDDNKETPINTPVTYNPLINDTYPTGSKITKINGVTPVVGTPIPVTGGTVILNADGTVTVTPTPGSTTPIKFPYEVTTPDGRTATANDTVTIVSAVDDKNATTVDTPLTYNPLANDNVPTGSKITTINGTPVVFPTPGQPSSPITVPGGKVVVNPDGSVTVTPNPGSTSTITFPYEVTTPSGSKVTAIDTITLTTKVCIQKPISSVDFGTSNPNPGTALPASQTSFTYIPGPDYPSDGNYTIGSLDSYFKQPLAWGGTSQWQNIPDRSGIPSGDMMIINGANPGQAVYQQTVNLTAGSSVKFNYWVYNLMNLDQTSAVSPQIGAQIKDSSGAIVANVTGLTIPLGTSWKEVTLELNVATTGTYTVAVMSNGPAARGNDYAIDDISIVETTCKADLEVIKTVSNPNPLIGEIVEYTLVVKNNGPDTATVPIVTDVMPAGVTYESATNIPSKIVGQNLTWNLADMASGGTQIIKYKAKVTALGVQTNNASVNSLATLDPVPANNKSSSTITATGTGKLELIKVGTPIDLDANTMINAGDKINYSFTVKNTGDVVLTNVGITDSKCSPIVGGPIASFAVGAINTTTFTCSYTITQADVTAGKVENTATVTGTDPLGKPVIDKSDSTDPTKPGPDDPTITPISQMPKIELDKSGTLVDTNGNGLLNVGEKINYTFIVKNTGNVPLTSVTITDPLPGIVISGGPISLLAVGAIDTTTFTATYTVTQADVDKGNVTNQATATGQPPLLPDGSTPPKVTDTSNDPKTTNPNDPTVIPLPELSKIELIKTSTLVDTNSDGFGQVGEKIQYKFQVKNTGTTTLTNIVITDSKCSPITGSLATLAVGVIDATTFTCLYTLSASDISAGKVENTALATAKDPSGKDVKDTSDSNDPTKPGPDDPTVTPLPIKAVDDTKETAINTPITYNSLLNDIVPAGSKITAIDGKPVTIGVPIPVTGGTVTVNADGTITVTPTPGSTTPIVFPYTITTPDGRTTTAIDTITVVKAVDDIKTTQVDKPITYNPLTNDNVPPGSKITEINGTPVVIGTPITVPGGTVVVNSDGTVTVTPTPGSTTPVVFPYTVTTPTGTKVTAVDTITIIKAVDDIKSTPINTPITYNPLVNDTVPPGSKITEIDGKPVTPGVPIVVPGGTVTVNNDGTVTVTPDPGFVGDIKFPYTVTTPDGTKVSAIDTVTVIGNGKIELIKTSLPQDLDGNGMINIGDKINYSFSVKNTGDVPLNNVTITDSKCSPINGGPLPVLAVAATNSTTFTCAYTLTQADITAGKVENTAVATAKDPLGKVVTDTSDSTDPTKPGPDDPTVTPITQTPKLELDKSGSLEDTNGNGLLNVGEKINYVFTVRNTGNVPLTNVTVTDTLIGITITGGPIATLAVGASDSTTFKATYTVTQQDVDKGNVTNQATASGQPPLRPDGTQPPRVTATSNDPKTTAPGDPTVIPLPELAKIELIKSSTLIDTNSNGYAEVGEKIKYSFNVKNTGTVTLKDITIADSKCSPIIGGPLTTLAPLVSDTTTFSCIYTITAADITAMKVENTATVTGKDPSGKDVKDTSDSNDPTKPGTDDPTVTPLPLKSSIELDKEGTFKDDNADGKAQIGESILYKFTVKNTGQTTLTNIVISDPVLISPSGSIVGGPLATLAPGAVNNTTFTGFHILTQADITAGKFENTATVTAKDPTGKDVSDKSNDPKTLTPDDPTVILIPQSPKLELDKVGVLVDTNNNGLLNVGEKIAYTLTVKNTGNVPLTNVVINDPLPGIVFTGGPIATFPVGAVDTTTFKAEYIVTQADVDAGKVTNQATASGQPPLNPDGTQPPRVTATSNDPKTTAPNDPTVVPFAGLGKLELIKASTLVDTNLNGFTDVGETIKYNFSVKNVGTLTIKDITITDTKCSPVAGTILSLAPGAIDTSTFTCTYTITQADILAGKVENTATATGKDPSGNPVTDKSDSNDPTKPGPEDPTVTPLVQNPKIELIKKSIFVDSNNNGIANVGESILYTFTVKNTGNTVLTNIEITDNKCSPIIGGPLTTLVVGATDTTTFSCNYTLTQGDLTLGKVENSAIVTAKDPLGKYISDTSDSTDPTKTGPSDPTITLIPQSPKMELDKIGVFEDSNNNGLLNVGERINYTFTIRNTGNVPLTNVTISDPLVGIVLKGGPIATLPVGAVDTTTFTATYTVTQSDVDAGKVTNQATATGQPPVKPDGTPADPIKVPSNDPKTTAPGDPTVVPFVGLGKIELIKLSQFEDLNINGYADVGEVIRYLFAVKNVGTLTLTDINITDNKCSPIFGGPIQTLAPGVADTTTFYCTYTITQADITAGKVENSAVAKAKDPQGKEVIDTSDSNDPSKPGKDDPTITTLKAKPPLIPNIITARTGGQLIVLNVIAWITFLFTFLWFRNREEESR